MLECNEERLKPTNFQKLVLVRAEAAAQWLIRSIKACKNNGSAAFYSRWYHPIRGWSWPYPETTGYIIPTLITYAQFSSQSVYADLAAKQAEWIMSLQFDNGALPGGAVKNGKKAGPSIFNTGQMIFGLVATADHTQNDKFLQSAREAAHWLAEEVDPISGKWERYSYKKGFSPAYYTRVCWAMLEVWSRTGDPKIKDAAVRALETIATWQRPKGSIENWSFHPSQQAFTHTIAYTLRGFFESAMLLGQEGQQFLSVSIKPADILRRRMELRGRLAGAYDLEFKGTYWYSCLTGNCQMALLWMRIYEFRKDARYLSAALKALQYVIDRQRMFHLDPNIRGSISGSAPLWGRYLILRYPNWAVKFYLDALIKACNSIQTLLETGPCALS